MGSGPYPRAQGRRLDSRRWSSLPAAWWIASDASEATSSPTGRRFHVPLTCSSGRRWIAASVDLHWLSDQVTMDVQWFLSYDDVDKVFVAAASRRRGEKIVGYSITFSQDTGVAFLVNWVHAGRRRLRRQQVRAAAGRPRAKQRDMG